MEAKLMEANVFPSPEMDDDIATTNLLCRGERKLMLALRFRKDSVIVDFGLLKIARLLRDLLRPIIPINGTFRFFSTSFGSCIFVLKKSLAVINPIGNAKPRIKPMR